ncbi:MAG: ABC transporter ATP-binding protein, partial [Chloroflexi bacterium]
MSIDRIVVERATKRYAAITVFERLELAVREGETLCVLGPSGCG